MATRAEIFRVAFEEIERARMAAEVEALKVKPAAFAAPDFEANVTPDGQLHMRFTKSFDLSLDPTNVIALTSWLTANFVQVVP